MYHDSFLGQIDGHMWFYFYIHNIFTYAYGNHQMGFLLILFIHSCSRSSTRLLRVLMWLCLSQHIISYAHNLLLEVKGFEIFRAFSSDIVHYYFNSPEIFGYLCLLLKITFPELKLAPILSTIVLAKILPIFAKFMPAWCSTFQKRAL